MPDSEAQYLMDQLTKFRKGEIVVQQSMQSDKDKTMLLRRNVKTGKIEAVAENKQIVQKLTDQVNKTSPRSSVISDSGNDERSGSLSPRLSLNSLAPEKKTSFPWVQEKRYTMPASVDFQSKLENNLKRQADVKNASKVLPSVGAREIAMILESTSLQGGSR